MYKNVIISYHNRGDSYAQIRLPNKRQKMRTK